MRSVTLDIQICDEIKYYIQSNNLRPGDKLPPERQLAEMFNVQILTVRQAIKRLINENLIYSVEKGGNFIAEQKIKRNLLKFDSLTKTFESEGYKLKTKVIEIKIIESNKILSRNLEITLGTKVYRIKRLRIVDNMPIALEISYIPADYVQGIENYISENVSLYEILENQYHIKLANVNQNIFMIFADDEESRFLGINEGHALLMLKGTAVDSQKRKTEYSESVTRGDRCIFTSILRKPDIQL